LVIDLAASSVEEPGAMHSGLKFSVIRVIEKATRHLVEDSLKIVDESLIGIDYLSRRVKATVLNKQGAAARTR
jgi:hypothetical protein